MSEQDLPKGGNVSRRLVPRLRAAAASGWQTVAPQGQRLIAAETSPRLRMKIAGAGLAALVAIGALFVYTYAALLLPLTPGMESLRAARAENPSIVLSADGQEIVRYHRLNRKWVGLDSISAVVVDALIATEDRRFYGHHGIDLYRLGGSVIRTVEGKTQGGSTLTMQLARNLYPERIGRQVSFNRKMKEMVTALKIEMLYTKPEILETYLNTVPFLYNTFGIEMAAQTYFGTSATELDTLQAATLVGMLKGASYYNPVRNPERALQRRNLVLAQLNREGKLSAGRLGELAVKPVTLNFERQSVLKSKAPHFTAYLKDRLTKWADQHDYDLYTDGLVIRTTLDLRLQELAQKAVKEQGAALQAVADVEWGRSGLRLLSTRTSAYESARTSVQPFEHFWSTHPSLQEEAVRATVRFRELVENGYAEAQALDTLSRNEAFLDSLRAERTRVEAGFVAIDPTTGFVKAWVGSRDFYEGPYDHVATARRQPGSTFKPFVYAAALESGHTPDDLYRDREVDIPLEGGGVWRPANSGGSTGEMLTLRQALSQSKNTISAQLIGELGPDRVADAAERMGVRQSSLEKVPSLALGTSDVTLLEMVSAYGTIASAGTYHPPLLLTSIENDAGQVIERFADEEQTVLDRDTALLLLDMMRGVVDEGTGRGVRSRYSLRGDLAGKTGTTQNNGDGWFILMHPQLVAGAWVGFNDRRVTFRSNYWGQGAHNALLIVGDFFKSAIRADRLDAGAAFPPPPWYEAPERRERTVLGRIGTWFERRVDGIFGREDRKPSPPRDRERRKKSPSTTADSDERRPRGWGAAPSEDEKLQAERRADEMRAEQKAAVNERKEREKARRDRLREEAKRVKDSRREEARRPGW